MFKIENAKEIHVVRCESGYYNVMVAFTNSGAETSYFSSRSRIEAEERGRALAKLNRVKYLGFSAGYLV